MIRSNSTIITPEDLKVPVFRCENLYVEENKRTLVAGKIKDTSGMPVKNAALLVYKVKDFTKELLGFIESGDDGNFYVFLDKETGVNYVIEIFRTL